MTSFGHWQGWADSSSLDNLVGFIYTNRNAATADHDAVVYEKVASLPAGSRVLDFGCGVGRNVIHYATNFPSLQFVGYDSDSMLRRADEFCQLRYGRLPADIPNLSLGSHWELLAAEEFDAVYATVVFQHIHPAQLSSYLVDIKRMTPRLWVFGRRFNDHGGGGVWATLEAAGLRPTNAAEIGYAVDGDPNEHLPLCIYATQNPDL